MGIIDFETLKSALRERKDKRVMLTFHSLGDTDSVSSAFVLSEWFSKSTIAAPDKITFNSRRILERLGFADANIANLFLDDADLVVMLDVNNFEDCGAFREKLQAFPNAILIIDHHAMQRVDKPNVMVFNDESYNSTASIVFEALKPLGMRLGRSEAQLLAAGIISDSAELRNASAMTFTQIGELLRIANVDYAWLLHLIQHMAPPESRLELIKWLFKSQLSVVAGLLFITGAVKEHANVAADNAIKLGADLALFHSSNQELSFSARLRPPLDRELGLHLGDVMRKLAPMVGGHGGGHPCAAGAYGPVNYDASKFAEAFITEIEDIVSKRYPGGFTGR